MIVGDDAGDGSLPGEKADASKHLSGGSFPDLHLIIS